MAPTEPSSAKVVRLGGVAGAATSAPTPDCKPVAAAALEACWLAESTGTWPEAATAHRLLAGISIYALRSPLAVVGPLLTAPGKLQWSIKHLSINRYVAETD